MALDENLPRRNALVIIGGLLAFYTLLFVLWAAFWRPFDVVVSTALWVAIVLGLILGAVLLILGFVLFPVSAKKRKGVEHLFPGTGVHFTLALLLSLAVVSLGWYVGATAYERWLDGDWIAFYLSDGAGGEVAVRWATIALYTFGLALAALVPFWSLLAHHWRMRNRAIADLEK